MNSLRLKYIIPLALLIGVLLVAAAALAPMRGWAQDMLSRFSFTNQLRELPVPNEAPVNMTTSNEPQGAAFSLTREQAQAQLDFALKLPEYLPADYRQQQGFQITRGPNGVSSVMWRASRSGETLCNPSITFGQSRSAPATTQPIGSAKAKIITVADAPGLWVERVPTGTCAYHNAGGTEVKVTWIESILSWEQDGVHYYVAGDSNLGLSEMLKVAESLR